MEKDEVEDNGISVRNMSDKDILEETKERLRQVGNLVRDIGYYLKLKVVY